MNIAEQILQNRFPHPKSRQQNQTLSANHNQPHYTMQSNTNNTHNIPQQRMYYIPPQNIQYIKSQSHPMTKSKSHYNVHSGSITTTHFNIGHTVSTTNSTQSRPQSTSTWQRKAKSANNINQFANTHSSHPLSNKSQGIPYRPHKKLPKPPIRVKQSYTPPSYPPNNATSPKNRHSRYKPKFKQLNNQRKMQMQRGMPNSQYNSYGNQSKFNTMQPRQRHSHHSQHNPNKRRSHVVTSHTQQVRKQRNYNGRHNGRNSNKYNGYNINVLPPINQKEPQIPNHKSDPNELPLGWAKLKDNKGLYYFNVITAEKQRTRPTKDASLIPKKLVPYKPLPLPYSRDVAPSVITDDMSVAEIEYRKNNGSLVFAQLLNNTASKQEMLINQENWDMLVDAIYLNLTPNDYNTVFKALRSIAENLFDEDDKYRLLYADNKKVQQRILSRIGGYEFLRGVGFREVTKRKLICDYPDFDVVATAITAINAKLSVIEKRVQLPIIPPKLKEDVKEQKQVEIEVDIDQYLANKNHPKKEKNEQMSESISKRATNLVKLEMDNVVSDIIKSDGPQIVESYDNDEEEKKAILHNTDSLDLCESNMEGSPRKKVSSPKGRNRNQSQITSAYYTDEEEEKLGIITGDNHNKETDAGFTQTEAYFERKREKIRNRKRSLSWSKKEGTKANKHHKNSSKASELPYQRYFHNHPLEDNSYEKATVSPKSNHSQHRHTLPPKQLVQNIHHATTPQPKYVIRKKKKSSKKRGRRHNQSDHTQQRSSSVSSPRTKVTLPKKFSLNDVGDIENEIERAFIDTQKKLTLNQLRLNEEEDVESLFDDDDDLNLGINYGHKYAYDAPIIYTDIAKPHDDFYVGVGVNYNKNTNPYHQTQHSRDDIGMNNGYQNYGNMPMNAPQIGTHVQHTNSDGNLQQIWGNIETSPRIPRSPKALSPRAKRHKPKGRSNSFDNKPLPPKPHISILLPSEKKKIAKKGGKKKRAQKIRKSVGAFFNHFTSKKNPKYSVEDFNQINKQRNEYRAQHPSDEEEHYAYYGDPQKQSPKGNKPKKQNSKRNLYFLAAADDYLHIAPPKNAKNSQNIPGTHNKNVGTNVQRAQSNIVNGHSQKQKPYRNPNVNQTQYTHNPPNLLRSSPSPKLKAYSPRSMREIEVGFEDETTVKIECDLNIVSVNMISLALEKRGWSATMTHLFNLCIKDDDPKSDSLMIATLENDAKPIQSLPQFVQHLKLKNPMFIITAKHSD